MGLINRLLGGQGFYGPGHINRNALVIEPKQPFVDWINSCPETSRKIKLEEMRSDCAVFLIPLSDYEHEDWLKENYMAIFAFHLDGWYRNSEIWPKDLSFENFKRFFGYRYASSVLDCEFGWLEKEDF